MQPHEKKRETVPLVAYFRCLLALVNLSIRISAEQFTPEDVNLRNLILG